MVAIWEHYTNRLNKLPDRFVNLLVDMWNIRKNNLHISTYSNSLQLTAAELISQTNAITAFSFPLINCYCYVVVTEQQRKTNEYSLETILFAANTVPEYTIVHYLFKENSPVLFDNFFDASFSLSLDTTGRLFYCNSEYSLRYPCVSWTLLPLKEVVELNQYFMIKL